jgi:hypothetical protein
MNLGWIGGIAVAGVQLVVFLRWAHRRMRDDEINRAFVRDMATNHLPHLYGALRQIAQHQGVELSDPPPIKFIEFNGDKGH